MMKRFSLQLLNHNNDLFFSSLMVLRGINNTHTLLFLRVCAHTLVGLALQHLMEQQLLTNMTKNLKILQ